MSFVKIAPQHCLYCVPAKGELDKLLLRVNVLWRQGYLDRERGSRKQTNYLTEGRKVPQIWTRSSSKDWMITLESFVLIIITSDPRQLPLTTTTPLLQFSSAKGVPRPLRDQAYSNWTWWNTFLGVERTCCDLQPCGRGALEQTND